MLVSATLRQLGNHRALWCSIALLLSAQVIRAFAVQPSFRNLPLAIPLAKMTCQEDPYIFLEDVESEESLQFARDANDACLRALGDPTKSETGTYDRVLKVLESDDRIPYVSKYGRDDDDNEVLYNFWKDSKVSLSKDGVHRPCTSSLYVTSPMTLFLCTSLSVTEPQRHLETHDHEVLLH